MCLAVPGKIVRIDEGATGGATGVLDLQGNRLEVSLALLPTVDIGSWVLVHAGYAIQELDEEEAKETWRWLSEAGVVDTVPDEMRTDTDKE